MTTAILAALATLFALLAELARPFGLAGEVLRVHEAVRDFLGLGGEVMFGILGLLIVMWLLIIERFLYFTFAHRRYVRRARAEWEARPERRSWHAHRIRELLIAEVGARAEGPTRIIQALVALCPLLGLLGTVTGMIEVFEVMAISGSGNPRSMAAGASKATVPTMAGMVAALSGLFLATMFAHRARRETELLDEQLTTDH